MSAPYYQDEQVTVLAGDCLEVLRSLPDASVHAVVTDPPYGLANTSPEQVADTIVRWVNGDRDYLPGGSGFMGKAWDAFVPPVAVWDECLRVLKPGGHLLAFAGSRTMDLMSLGIRLAGFEIRDSIAWLYGSGFPKSLDVSKAIDKRRDEDNEPSREVATYLLAALKASPLTQREAEERLGLGFNSLCNFIQPNRKSFGVPRWELWERMKEVIGFGDDLDAEVWRLNRRKGQPGDAWQNAEVVGVRENAMTNWSMDGTTKFVTREDKAPATPDAERWQGWGTALKPAFEPIVVARKPLTGTVAANVLEHGTGALNIDATRTDMGAEYDPTKMQRQSAATAGMNGLGESGFSATHQQATYNASGRWPTNVLLDDTQAAELDRQSGATTSRIGKPRGAASGDGWGMTATGAEYDDEGGASRFFPTFRYEAKAPTDQRPRVNGIAHPTVKPLDLMRWLVRLVTPPGGTILDPFAGSGTTLEAALIEGFQCIGIEREADYLPLIKARITKPIEPVLDLGGIA